MPFILINGTTSLKNYSKIIANSVGGGQKVNEATNTCLLQTKFLSELHSLQANKTRVKDNVVLLTSRTRNERRTLEYLWHRNFFVRVKGAVS